MRSKLARWLAAASLLVLVTAPAFAASSSNTGKGWLGVSTQSTDADLKKGLDLTQDGLVVNQVTRESPADRAGVRKGDVILSYNSRNVTTPEQLRDLVRDTDPGRSIALLVWRDGAKKSLTVKVGDVTDSGDDDSYDAPVPPEPPTPPGAPSAPRAPRSPHSTRVWSNDGDVRMWVDGKELTDDEIKDRMKDMKWKMKDLDDLKGFNWQGSPDAHVFVAPMARSRGRLGVRVDDLSDDMAQALGVSSKGALVTEVLEDTPAQKAGIRAGDVITRVGGDEVDDPDDLTRALRDRQGKVSIELVRRGDKRTVDVDIPSRDSLGRSRMQFSEPGSGSWGYWKSKDDDGDGDAALRREIEDLKREIAELREQMKTKK